MTETEADVAALLAPYVRAEAIPEVMRRPVDAFGGRSLLELADSGEVEAVRAWVAAAFDLRRVQP